MMRPESSSEYYRVTDSPEEGSRPLRRLPRLSTIFDRVPDSQIAFAAETSRQLARPEPTPAFPGPLLYGRETSISPSNSSRYSMDSQRSLASSATSPHQLGTDRASPTPSPSHGLPPVRLPPIKVLIGTLPEFRLDHHDPFAHGDPFADSLFNPDSKLVKHRLHGPLGPMSDRFSQPQRGLPDFDPSLPPSTPSNCIDRDHFCRRTAYSGVPRPPGKINPRPPPPRPPTHARHRSPPSMNGTPQRKRRGNIDKRKTEHLRIWFLEHIAHPYPTEEEKRQLMEITGLTHNQVCRSVADDVLNAFADRACRSPTGSSTPDGVSYPN